MSETLILEESAGRKNSADQGTLEVKITVLKRKLEAPNARDLNRIPAERHKESMLLRALEARVLHSFACFCMLLAGFRTISIGFHPFSPTSGQMTSVSQAQQTLYLLYAGL